MNFDVFLVKQTFFLYRALTDCACSVGQDLSRNAEHCESISRDSTPWSRNRLLTRLVKSSSF